MMAAWAICLATLIGCDTEQMQITDSGYNYVTCVDLEGNPGAQGDWVFIHARGTVPSSTGQGDSVVFDTHEDGRPTPIQLPQAGAPRGQLSPLQDVLALMSEGDSLRFEYPLDSMSMQAAPMGDHVDAITYHVKVYDIMTPEQFSTWRSNEMKKATERLGEIEEFTSETYGKYTRNELSINRTESGLGYIIHEQGNSERAVAGDVIDAQYYGFLASDGSMFDNSFQRGQPFTFQVGMGMVIPGWDEGFQLLGEGAKATLFIPSELGYGERGSGATIPPGSELIFYVELENIR